MKLRFIGCMVGCAVGDTLGASSYSLRDINLEQVGFVNVPFKGRWTDDTHMMIGVAESLIECEGFDEEHMIQTFIKNWELEPWRGYGPGPPRIFRLVKRGVSWRKASQDLYGGEGSFGNGAAMRIAPIGLLYHENSKTLREIAARSAKLTHSHRLGVEGAVLQAYAVAQALKSSKHRFDPVSYLELIENFTVEDIYRSKLRLARILIEEDDKRVIRRKLGNTVEAFNSVPTAVYSFAKNYDDFVKAVLYAVSLGGDSDTIGAMTGAIAGAFTGINGIPEIWKSRLEKLSYIMWLAEKIWDLKNKMKS